MTPANGNMAVRARDLQKEESRLARTSKAIALAALGLTLGVSQVSPIIAVGAGVVLAAFATVFLKEKIDKEKEVRALVEELKRHNIECSFKDGELLCEEAPTNL